MGTLDLLLSGKLAYRWVNHRYLYLLGLAVILCGLGWSHLLMSVGQFILIGNWILELNFKNKLRWMVQNKLFWILISLFLLHVIGLAWTSDFEYGFKDIRIKLPLLVMPVILASSKQLNKNEWKFILGAYFSSLLLLSLASLSKLLGLTVDNLVDKRELAIKISHIRYGLNLAIAACLTFFFRKLYLKKEKLAILLLGLWFITCIIIFQLYTALICFLLVLFFKLLHLIFFKSKLHWKAVSLLIISITFYFIYFLVSGVNSEYNSSISLDYNQDEGLYDKTAGGEQYWSDINDSRLENGVYIRRFIAWKELEREWAKRSDFDFDSLDLKGQYLSHTITRYLSSKGLKKDSIGLSKLSDEEINAIENGIANTYYLNHSALENRIHRSIYEFDNYNQTGLANGFSLAMRMEFWETALKIISKNKLIGVGTGDINDAFKTQYNLDQSLLDEQYRRRAHNQYLTFLATFGIFGFAVFILFLVLPLFYLKQYRSIYLCFWLIATLSYLTEDTLETQAGATYIAFFTCIFLLNQAFKPTLPDTAEKSYQQ